jgi:hypothetical protein
MSFQLVESHDDRLVFEICDECSKWTGRHGVKGGQLMYAVIRCTHVTTEMLKEENAKILDDIEVT